MKNLVILTGAGMSAESELNVGTKFIIVLPLLKNE